MSRLEESDIHPNASVLSFSLDPMYSLSMAKLNTTVLLGAGRGSRLMPLTTSQPKSFATIAGKRILDWTLDAFLHHGLDNFVFVSGYLKHVVKYNYPNFQFVENPDWASTNILHSLMCARTYLTDGFYSTYTDTIFREHSVGLLKRSQYDITLVMDTDWRTRYRFRSEHPESDAEKMIAENNQVVRISRQIAPDDASGEFTGVLKMTPYGAKLLVEYYDNLLTDLGPEGTFTEDKPFRLAYLIHLIDQMIKSGVTVNCVSVSGDYHEIDTLQDYELAKTDWERFSDD